MPVHFIGKKPTNNIIFLKIISKKHNDTHQKQHDIIYNKLFMLSSKKIAAQHSSLPQPR